MTGLATLGAAALTLGLTTTGGNTTTDAAPAASTKVATTKTVDTHTSTTGPHATDDQKINSVAEKLGVKTDDAKKDAAQKKAAAAKKEKAEKAEKAKKAAAKAKAERGKKQAANRSTHRTYANNLDGWIRESLAIMKEKGIPGSYEGLHRNILRESSGNPKAINDWDINAQNGIPSKGLLQVIPPTFEAYHVEGTPKNIYDPVANITAAANYAADKYGSMDNVDSAY
ncbi:transglycosylase SLT domain-containing protein [Streptomyces sp. NA04227]|uniref:transglycosylase SLT domain-containing protein n=1 Tax=Streptomyces sp. NA04227 TaxID=2742136 RepID=UPI001592380D|nr:transglycosylase SLT domain-containing protein [Streptomyces sp. NA04227]QKW11250.1 transglycosylase SLT domain-containing protein [Streptomyces sp. NA04227]